MAAADPPENSLYTRLPFFYGWVVVGVAFVTLAVAVNVRTSFSLLYPPILDEFGWSRGSTAAIFSAGFLASVLFSPLVGAAMDRWGPRLVMPASTLLVAGGLALATLAGSPWLFSLTLGVMVVGCGIALAFIGHGALLPHWFRRRRGLAVGIAFAGAGLGAIVLLPWLQTVIDGRGWRAACWAMVLLLVLLVLPLNAALQRRRPEDVGLNPDGRATENGNPGQAAEDSGVVDPVWAGTDWTLKLALRQPRFWWLLIGLFSALYAWYAVSVHQTRYLLDIGFPEAQAAWALGFVWFLGIGGQVGIGYLSDRLGREWAWSLACLGFAACYLLLIVMETRPADWLLYLMVASQGLLGFGIAPMTATISAELFQGRTFGRIFGLLSAGGTLGGAVGPWASGLFFDATGSYAPAFWTACGFCGLSTLAIWLAAPRKVRRVPGLDR